MSRDGLPEHIIKPGSIELVGPTATTNTAVIGTAKVELEWKDESGRNNIFPIETYIFGKDIPEVNILGSSFFKKHKLMIDLANNYVVAPITKFNIIIGNTQDSVNTLALATNEIVDEHNWMEDTLEMEENHTMPAQAAIYFMENNLHLNDSHNDDPNEEREEEEPISSNWMRGVHLLETNEELASHPSIEPTEEISRNKIGCSELFGTTNANRDHNRIELLHSL